MLEVNIPHPIICVEQLTAGYEDKIALDKVSLSVAEKDFLGIIGPNGGGKTTLMKVILGMLQPFSGSISYYRNGQKVNDLTIGYLPQYNETDHHFPISVAEVVLSGLGKQKSIWGSYSKTQKEQAMATLEKMQLGDMKDRAIGSLSGGQLQRVLLARAIVSQPEVVLLDEPNTYIDKRFQEHMYKMLETINKECAVIIVSHDIGTILQNVKNVACVNKTLHYHAGTELPPHELEEHWGCPIELVGHGNMPHRVLKSHED